MSYLEDTEKEFYEIYNKAKAKWGLMLKCHRSITDGYRMEIHRDMGDKRECILRVCTEEAGWMYSRATKELQYYLSKQEEKLRKEEKDS